MYPNVSFSNEKDPVLFVSVIDLLVRHGDLSRSHISTAGFLGGVGNSNLYLTRDHAAVSDSASAIYASIDYSETDIDENGIPSTGCEFQFVRVYGYFKVINSQKIIDNIYKIEKTQNLGYDEPLIDTLCWSKSR